MIKIIAVFLFIISVAKLTAKIRFLQPIIEKRPSYKKRIKIVKELIDKRKKQLKLLRKQDYKKFEWILEELDLIYRPQVE